MNEVKQVQVFRELFEDDIKDIFSEVNANVLLEPYEELMLFSLHDMFDILETGDYLIDVEIFLNAIGLFGDSGYTLRETVFKVYKPDGVEPYIEHLDTFVDVRKLDFDRFLVVPIPRDFVKAKEEKQKIKERLHELNALMDELEKERIELYNKL